MKFMVKEQVLNRNLVFFGKVKKLCFATKNKNNVVQTVHVNLGRLDGLLWKNKCPLVFATEVKDVYVISITHGNTENDRCSSQVV